MRNVTHARTGACQRRPLGIKAQLRHYLHALSNLRCSRAQLTMQVPGIVVSCFRGVWRRQSASLGTHSGRKLERLLTYGPLLRAGTPHPDGVRFAVPPLKGSGRGNGVVHIQKAALRELMVTTFLDRALRV